MENGRTSEVVAIGDPYSSCRIPYSNTFDFQDGFGTLVDNEILRSSSRPMAAPSNANVEIDFER